jgi:hypothetical protein
MWMQKMREGEDRAVLMPARRCSRYSPAGRGIATGG